MKTHTRQQGFTMVEVLVALVVLAIGLLGIAALYLNSLQAGRTAIYRTEAVQLAADLADRIRMNRTAQNGYASVSYRCRQFSWAHAQRPAAARMPNSRRRTSSNWKTAIAQQLPGGQGQVVVTAARRRRRADQLRHHGAMARGRRSGCP